MQPVVTSVKGKVDNFVMEQGVAHPRHAREDSRVGIENGVEKELRWRAEGPSDAGFERCVSIVVREAGASRTRLAPCAAAVGVMTVVVVLLHDIDAPLSYG